MMTDTLSPSSDDSAVLEELAAEFAEELTDEAIDDRLEGRICVCVASR